MRSEFVPEIKEFAKQIGYTDCGIISAEPFEEFGKALQNRIERFPEISHLYTPLWERMDPLSFASWAHSIIVCIRQYGKYKIPQGLDAYFGRYYLFDHRNKACPDYDMPQLFEDGLKKLGFQVQRGRIPGRWASVKAGITRFGKNCFVYSQHGSWINIDTWIVDKELSIDTPTLELICPEGCQACIKACPTNALIEPFVMRKDRCIAYLTYEAPEPISSDLWQNMGSWIYGCDVCQSVCPLNKVTWESIKTAEWLEEIAQYLLPEALSTMDKETYHDKVYPHFWYIPVDNFIRWQKNARRALNCISAKAVYKKEGE